jgi:hypothetical protein
MDSGQRELNKQQIEALTDEQLNLAVAEARENKPKWLPKIDDVLFTPRWSPVGAWFCTADYSSDDVPMWLPERVTADTSAAWKLGKEMQKAGAQIDIVSTEMMTGVNVSFIGKQKFYRGEGPDLERAICRAYLAWKTDGEP